MKSILSILIIILHAQVMAQKAPSAISTVNKVPVKKSASVNGYGLNPEYPVANLYNLRFGSQASATDGVNNEITSFVVDGLTYKPIPRAGTTPYDNVILKRKVNPKVADLGKFTAFYQNNGGVKTNASIIPGGTALFYPPEYVGTMESLINSYIVNRGTDNLFANENGATLNNIERVDLIISGGVTAADVVKTGFLLMERGGNDSYKIAAITSLTPSGEIATLGNLVTGSASSWGSTGITITSTVFQRNTGDTEIRPNQNITPQLIAGSYISFQSLGIPARTTIYGIALFPDDVTSSTDLLNLTDVPLKTGAASGLGGLDFMAGGGFFVEEHVELAFSLSGNIFDDGNALVNSMVDGVGIGVPSGSQLYAYLVGEDNLVKAKFTVTPDGTYVFDNQLTGNTNYTVVISTTNVAVANAAPAGAALPDGWVITGDDFGNSNQSGSGVQTGSPDLRIPVKAVDASITNVNFGIEQKPFAGSGAITLPNPGGTTSAVIPANTFTNISASKDYDGNITSLLIGYPAANANSITIGGTKYTASEFATAFPSNAYIPTDVNGNPIPVIEVDPIDGTTTVVFPFIVIDNAYINSANTGTATINFLYVNKVPVASNDVNSTNEDTPVNGSVTGNDTPSEDGGNVWTLVGTNGGASHGIVTMAADGTYTYTPAANYNGTDVFNYKVCDVDNDCASATVTITIVPVNDAPIALNDVNSTNEDTPVNGSVTGNDTPSGDGGNVWTLVGTNGGAAHGTVTMASDGTYTYTPAANYNGTDVFNYKVCDVDNDCASATVTITIVPVNDVPVAVNDVNSTNEDTPVNGSVTGNDTPSGDGGNVWTLVGTNGGASHGTVTMATDGTYTYTPAANYNGSDVFNYKVCDADNDCSSATVTITIVPVNDVPVAVNDINSTNEDTPVNGSVTGNDMPSGDGSNVWTLVGTNGGAAHGTVTMAADGTYTYTPAANYTGTDVFNYKVCDADNDCSSATVTITIVPVNDVPVAVNDVNSTNEDTPVNGGVTGNDTPSGDGGNVWTLVGANGGATHGTVTMAVNGTYTYSPAANYNGTDVFNYKVCDADNDCSSATVTITIVPVNDLPVAVNDVNSTNEDTPVNGSVAGNDTPSGDGGNVWTLVGANGGATHGTVTMAVNGTYTYSPAANYNGTDVFNYKVCDADNDCSSATVTITTVPVNDVPVAVNDVNSTNEDTPVNGSVTGNDTPSGDGGNVWTLVGTNGGASHGTVTIGSNGTYTYTPAAHYNGTDVFTYKVCDVNNDCSSATVTITIVPVNDAPIAANDVNSTNEDTPVNGSVSGNDTPSGDGGNVWTLVGTNGGAANGTVTMASNGTYTYTPAANYNGTDVFTYKVCDVNNDCSSATVTITIVPVNDAPIAVNDVNSTNEDTPVNGSVTGNDTPSGDGGNVWTLVGTNGGASHGTVTMGSNGTYTYTPAANYNGTDVFTYKVCDVNNDCSSATVTITIVPVNDAPIAANDVNSTNEDTPVNGSVTGNDTPSGDGGNVWTLVGTNGGASHGTVTMGSNGTYTYTPAANYNGTDVFNYKVCDADNDCSSATVTITIVPVNDLPVAVNDVNSTNEDTPVNGSVTGNDTPSGDGGNVWTLVGTNGGASHGTVTIGSNGTYTYTPAAHYNGTDVFTYKVCDVNNDCSSARVTITIIPVNDLPVAVNDVNSTNQNTAVSGSVTGNDTPSADGGNVWSLVGANGGASHGTVTISSTGAYTYTPATNYTGVDVFNYKLCDANNDCSSATVTITIAPVVTFCGCTPAPTDILVNGSFENGNTGWSASGGSFTTGTGYVICGAKNAFLQRTSGTAKIWQDVTGIAIGSTVTLKAWAGTHTQGIGCSPKLILAFYNSAGTVISSVSANVDKDVDKPDYRLKEYTLTSVVPTGTVKVRVEGNITCNWLKLDAICLTATGGQSTGSIGNFVWNDVNNNGKQEGGEAGIAGAVVKLTYPGATTATITTDNNGAYGFTSLPAGTYKVTFTTPSGYAASAANQGSNDEIDSDPTNGEVSIVLAAGQTNNSIDAGFSLIPCTNTTQHSETYPNQYNTGFSTSLSNKTFTGTSGLWTANSNSKATIVVLKPYYSASTSYALKIVNYNTRGSGAGSCSAASPKLNLTGACCPEQLKMTFTLWTYACVSGDNNASLKLDFSNNNGSSWTEAGSATSADLFSYYGANGKVVITVAVPLSYQNANFKYRFRGEMAANNPNNFYLFIDDISITSPASCNSTTSAYRGVATNTLTFAKVKEVTDQLTVNVLSNPSPNAFQLNIKSSAAESITVTITDLFGRTLKVIKNVQPNTTLNVGDNLQTGNYFVEVKQNSITRVLKLVKL